MDNSPLVSIICLTFNHEKYIKKCLDGFVKQKVNFIFEIIVHDDASTDDSIKILRDYESKYPNLFNNIYQTVNQFNNKKINILYDIVFPKTKGKYVALCDGDDYWIDNNKLQTQFNFLENNLEFNLCYHDVKILKKNNEFVDDFINKTKKNITNVYDLAVWGNYIHTSSVFFRNNFSSFKSYPAEYFCDYFLYILVVNSGKIKKIQSVMSVYRFADGVWASSTNKNKYKFIIDNIHNLLNSTEDDTIREIMKIRLNSEAIYQIPPYINIIDNKDDRSVKYVLNDKIPFSILFNLIKFKIKKYKFLNYVIIFFKLILLTIFIILN